MEERCIHRGYHPTQEVLGYYLKSPKLGFAWVMRVVRRFLSASKSSSAYVCDIPILLRMAERILPSIMNDPELSHVTTLRFLGRLRPEFLERVVISPPIDPSGRLGPVVGFREKTQDATLK